MPPTVLKKRVPTPLPTPANAGKVEKPKTLPKEPAHAKEKIVRPQASKTITHPALPTDGAKKTGAGRTDLRSVPKNTKPAETQRVRIEEEPNAKEAPKEIAKEPKVRKSKEASEPAVPSRKPATSRQPRFTPTVEEIKEYEGQLDYLAMLELSFTAKHELWRNLNKTASEGEFITLLKPSLLPKEIRKDFPPAKAVPPSKEALWCVYCGEWMKFRTFSYNGYEMCVGCAMSTKDFYIARANKLFFK
jgi:hypothetical protein